MAVAVTAFLCGAVTAFAQSAYPPVVAEPASLEAPASEPVAPVAAPPPPEEESAPVVVASPAAEPEATPKPTVRIYDASTTATPAPVQQAAKPLAKPAVQKPTAKPSSPKATSSKPAKGARVSGKAGQGAKGKATTKTSAARPVAPKTKVTAKTTQGLRKSAPAKPATSSTPKRPTVAAKPRPASGSVGLERRRVLGRNVIVVRVNMNDQNVHITPVLPTRGLGKGASFDALVRGSSAVAVINGGYFHPRTFSLAGDLVVKGRHVSSGRVRTTLGITRDNKVVVRKTTSISRKGWKEFETAIGNGPFILHNGKLSVYPKSEGYRDRAVWSSAARSAIGITKSGKLLFVSTKEKLDLYELAKILRALGATDGIVLDGGSSVGMAYRGKVLLRPARSIAYGIGVYVTNAKVTETRS